MYVNIIIIGLNIFILMVGLYLAFVKSYFIEKGKQLAVKEDIEEITEKVEKIKTDFIRETEIIKSDLSLLNQNKFSMATEERESIFDFNTKLSLWLNTILNSDPLSMNHFNDGKKNEMVERMESAKFNFDISESRINLFIQDTEFIKLKQEVIMPTLKLQHNKIKFLGEVELILFNIDSISTKLSFDQQHEELERHYKEKNAIFDKYSEELKRLFATAYPEHLNLIFYLRSRLIKLIDKDAPLSKLSS